MDSKFDLKFEKDNVGLKFTFERGMIGINIDVPEGMLLDDYAGEFLRINGELYYCFFVAKKFNEVMRVYILNIMTKTYRGYEIMPEPNAEVCTDLMFHAEGSCVRFNVGDSNYEINVNSWFINKINEFWHTSVDVNPVFIESKLVNINTFPPAVIKYDEEHDENSIYTDSGNVFTVPKCYHITYGGDYVFTNYCDADDDEDLIYKEYLSTATKIY